MTRSQLQQINDNMKRDWEPINCGDGRTVTRTELGPAPLGPARGVSAACPQPAPQPRLKDQLVRTAAKAFSDLSREKDPRCTACQTRGERLRYRPRDVVRYSGPCVPLKTSREPANTSIYQQSITVRDFGSPGTEPPWTRTKGNRRSFYHRFLSDMCRLCVLTDPIPGHGSLAGQRSQYQADFDPKPGRTLADLYSLPSHCRSPVSATASAYATCHMFCNF